MTEKRTRDAAEATPVSEAPPRAALRGKQRKHLRGLGMSLEPIVFLGKASVTDAVVAEVRVALAARELVKVKLLESVGGDRHEIAARVAAAAEAELIQVIGRNFLLYRPSPEKPRIVLPD